MYESIVKKNQERAQSLMALSMMKGVNEKELVEYTLEEIVRLTDSDVGYLHFVNPDQNSISLYSWSKGTLENCTAVKVPDYP